MYSYFFRGEVQPSFRYAVIQLVQMFQQPHAGAAMHPRHIEAYYYMRAVCKFIKLFCNIFVIKVSIFIISYRLYLRKAGGRGYGGISAKTIFIQYFINQLTAFTAKYFFLYSDIIGNAWCAAMVAKGFLLYRLLNYYSISFLNSLHEYYFAHSLCRAIIALPLYRKAHLLCHPVILFRQ